MARNEHLRRYLQRELEVRLQNNPRYSLRAFANYCGVHHSTLSRFLRKRTELSQKNLDTIARVFQIDSSLFASRANWQKLSNSQMSELDHWLYDAILELTLLDDFDPSPIWMANRLGLEQTQVNLAFNKLVSMRLIHQEEGVYKLNHEKLSHTSTQLSSSAKRTLQKNYLMKSMRAIDEIPRALRDHGTMTFAFDESQIAKAQELLKGFRRTFQKKMSTTKASNSVYTLAVSFFPLTRTTNSKEE